jgi:hypothetical protein
MEWLEYMSRVYMKSNSFDHDEEFRKSIGTFRCKRETKLETVKHSLELTKTIILPVLDKVVDLDSCIEYFHAIKGIMHIYDDAEDFAKKDKDNEGLLYIKTGKYGYHMCRKREIQLTNIANRIKAGDRESFIDSDGDRQVYTRELYEEHLRIFEEEKYEKIAQYDQIYDNHEWCAKANVELERRKVANTSILRTYGFNV